MASKGPKNISYAFLTGIKMENTGEEYKRWDRIDEITLIKFCQGYRFGYWKWGRGEKFQMAIRETI